MIEALLLIAGLVIGFAAAWALGGKTREELAETKARADEQARAAAEKLELVADTKSSLSDAFKALSAEALNTSSQTFLQLAKTQLGQFQERDYGELRWIRRIVG